MWERSHSGVDSGFMVMTGLNGEINLTTTFPIVKNGGGEVLVMMALL